MQTLIMNDGFIFYEITLKDFKQYIKNIKTYGLKSKNCYMEVKYKDGSIVSIGYGCNNVKNLKLKNIDKAIFTSLNNFNGFSDYYGNVQIIERDDGSYCYVL